MPRAAVALARVIHVVSASWVLVLGFIILVDVIGRAAFSTPFLGATEIIKNSIVAVTFLQIPLAIFSGSMIRTEILADSLPFVLRRLLRTLVYLLGAAFFALIVIASWSDAVRGFEIGEYEGEGALRVPVWPVRWLMIATSVFAGLCYLLMIWFDWTGQLEDEQAVPGALEID